MMLRSALRTAKSLRATRHTLRCASTLAGVLQENAAELPWREIVKDSKAGVKWSYSDLNEQTIAFANGLGELGLNVGDTIVTILPNNAENLVTTLAAGSIGVNVVPTTASTAGQLESVLATSGAKAVVFSKEAEDTIAKLLPDVVEQDFVVQDYESINDARFPELDAVITTDWELTDNQVVNFRTLFMYNNGNRCYVERAAANIDETVPLVGGATHKDILSAGGRVADKLGVTGNVQVALDSSKPEAIAVAAAAAMHGHALLHIGDAAASVDGAIVIDDAALA
mmetsp:Transcript_16791/g.24568  ORF Transcript_16791/g.24568 Transcript_16791/m.24568 type:complete len:283 (-) Transcript_16791:42-890(-)|eukprot:CAMPEP_0195521464 /NCGR_PEP_ID=MMETSP0794_2-20130614/18729_1 /TAXON_ID=515487 /ORGANISM="Stephanopyxis turris, Strain CCMP 815" /LENGTH=282 /DNA_ID=CAMNT_0040651027 /DNA_START=87 /DNA_END=935 /DNA_ORIENTATION=+